MHLHDDEAGLLDRMPKAELHLHLDGSLRPETALELARERGLASGIPDVAAMAGRLTAPEQCLDQADLLRAFDLPIAIMQDRAAIERITHELVLDIASDGTRYAEIRWAPALHLERGLTMEESIGAVADGARRGMDAAGIEVRLIAVALRSHPPETSLAVAREAVRFADRGMVGFDFAGREADFPDAEPHRAAFEAARAGGLGITIHAGEWGGAAQVQRALESVEPSRIAHGTPAADDPELMALLRERGVTLDLCPTSNVQAAIVPSLADHPLPYLYRAGVPVTLSTDDRTVSGLTLVREYERAHRVLGLSVGELWSINLHALRVAFLHREEALRARLIADFEAFAATEGLPATG
ncbi:MAG TPA: adenosine deaminase [Candidatus Limnocylindrales bacterium]|jgi:adenosine deaminase|nr:adenosine deaminase [Candidatus Limnocylindrales bacterium]